MKRRSRQQRSRLSYLLWLSGLAAGLAVLLAQPRWLLALAAKVRPGALYAADLPASSKVIALTIDDGPGSATADILAVLDRYDAKATFFNISGNLSGYEPIIQQTVVAGHELGNHMSADQPSIRLSPADFEADLLAAQAAALPYLNGNRLRWLRPGMGWYNAGMVATAQRHGYRLVLGSVFPYDTHMPFSRFAIAFILATASPGDIIVLHDGEGRGQRTVRTLEAVLPVLQARGYVITTVTGLLEVADDENAIVIGRD